MTHEHKQNVLLFFQGFFSVSLLGGGLVFMLQTAAKGSGWGAVGPLLLSMALIVAGGLLMAPGLARAVASPFGRLFYPHKPLEPRPLLSRARSLRQVGRFEDAMVEYRTAVEGFTGAEEAYLEMIDMAISDMADQVLGRELLLKALVTVEGDDSRKELRDCFDCACTVRRKETAGNPKIAFDLFEDDTEGVHGD